MAIIKSVNGLTPKWGKECYFSENAAIVGEVTMGDECSVWFNAVVRGDVGRSRGTCDQQDWPYLYRGQRDHRP